MNRDSTPTESDLADIENKEVISNDFIKLTPEALKLLKEICREAKQDFRQTKESQLPNNQ